ncbi:hypothetical protein [Oceanisphaera sp.]|uniref:hypothetical protein n=1 Tax=Oceanisphaera sp. TaxID=1929979 RepID=UPI003A916EBD
MAKVSGVLLQGVNYHWDGRDILVDDGVGVPWSLSGGQLEQIELFDGEGDPIAIFSIDFMAQHWSLVGDSQPESIILLDDSGSELSLHQQNEANPAAPQWDPALPLIRLTPLAQEADTQEEDTQEISTLADILNDADRLLEEPVTTPVDAVGFNNESIDDVLGWLAMYSHHD